MHGLYFVKLNKKEADTSRQALDRAQAILGENNFTYTGGFWGGGKCDSFVMGGRWSGQLSGLSITCDFGDQVCELVSVKEQDREERICISDAESKKYAEEIQSLWLSLGGKNANPYARDTYKHDGFDDDAVALSPEVINAIKKKYHYAEYFDNDAGEEKPISSLSPTDAGNWLAMVDYHY